MDVRSMDKRTRKILMTVVPLIIALISIFIIARYVSSVSFHAKTIASLDKKKTTVMQLAAVSTSASAAITLIPGDVATPIADKLADLSTYFIIVICAIYLEKYLLTITGYASFMILIPLGCALISLHVLMPRRGFDQIAKKLIMFGIAIVLVIPASVMVSEMIENTYSESIDLTVQQALQTSEQAAESIEDSSNMTDESVSSNDAGEVTDKTGVTEEEGAEEKKPWWQFITNATDTVSDTVQTALDNTVSGVETKIEEFKNMLNNMLEALAVMIVTSCLIPIIVLLFFVWLIKVILNVSVPMPPMGRPGPNGHHVH